jgi:hypothetical protein
MNWEREMPGWYVLDPVQGVGKAAVCIERDGKWHVYVHVDMPPGDSCHRTLREAKLAAEALVKAD